MSLPTLHKAVNCYWVGDYPLQISGYGTEWKIHSMTHGGAQHGSVMAWMSGPSGLGKTVYASRRAALLAIFAALGESNAPAAYPPAPCRRKATGVYQLAGSWTATRDSKNRRWRLEDGQNVAGWASSLWRAAQIAEQQTKSEPKAGSSKKRTANAIGRRGH